MSRQALHRIFVAVGFGLLVWLVARLGPARVLADVVRVGVSFVAVLFVYALELLLETEAWRRLIAPPRPPWLLVLCSNAGGTALGQNLPIQQAGEFIKGSMMQGHLPPGEIIASLVLYNYLYHLSATALFVLAPLGVVASSAGPWALLLSGLSLVFLVALVAAGSLMRAGLVHRLVGALVRIGWRGAARFETAARDTDVRLRAMRSERPGDFRAALMLLFVARALAIAEAWIILRALDPSMTLAQAGFLHAATQHFDWLTTFIPSRVGLLEVGAFAVFRLLGYPAELGGSLELVRRARKILFTGVGIALAWAGGRRFPPPGA